MNGVRLNLGLTGLYDFLWEGSTCFLEMWKELKMDPNHEVAYPIAPHHQLTRGNKKVLLWDIHRNGPFGKGLDDLYLSEEGPVIFRTTNDGWVIENLKPEAYRNPNEVTTKKLLASCLKLTDMCYRLEEKLRSTT